MANFITFLCLCARDSHFQKKVFCTILYYVKSIHSRFCYLILFYHPKKLLYQLYHIILQYTQHPNFYFPILLIKIIFLHNKIIYPTISIIYNTTHYLFFLSLYFCSTTTITTIAALHTPDTTTTTTTTTTNP